VMNNGMSILGIGIDYQQVIKGLVLLGAVCLDVYNQRRWGADWSNRSRRFGPGWSKSSAVFGPLVLRWGK